MSKRVLITGGAGFIGSHLSDLLLSSGYNVRLLDKLVAQVHGSHQTACYIHADSELVVGDVCNPSDVRAALKDVDAVVHLAAAVGVGQSMYEIVSYTHTNDIGTAVLLEALARNPVERLICASSMSVYGEGLAQRPDGTVVAPAERPASQLRAGVWDVVDRDGTKLDPLPTPESKTPILSSVYALNKYTQERLSLIVAKAYGIPAVALRFFNVYGSRQALSNPYTGVLAIFASRILNRKAPLVYEDGAQRRDFIHVEDVARACLLALERQDVCDGVFNVGSGTSRSILSIAHDVAIALGRPDLTPEVTRKYRVGDIRHCFADIARSRDVLGFSPKVEFSTGLKEFTAWLADEAAEDSIEAATHELEKRGLVA